MMTSSFGGSSLISATATAVCVLIFLPTSYGKIDCYECTVHPPDPYLKNRTTRLCSKFDGSDHYKVHCPDSTFCTKKSFWIELPDGERINSTVRGCASQKYEYQVIKDGKWVTATGMEYDSYKMGCHSGNENDLRTAETTFCYCDTNLCNNAKETSSFSSHTDTIAVIIIYNIMRFLKTHTQPA